MTQSKNREIATPLDPAHNRCIIGFGTINVKCKLHIIHHHELHQKVRYLAKEFKRQTEIIKNNHGETITDSTGVAEECRQYYAKIIEQ